MNAAALQWIPVVTDPCTHSLIELLSLDGRTLDSAVRVCAFCSAVVGELSSAQLIAIHDRAARLTSKGWEQYVELVVACEEALLGGPLATRARREATRLVGEAYARKWGAK